MYVIDNIYIYIYVYIQYNVYIEHNVLTHAADVLGQMMYG